MLRPCDRGVIMSSFTALNVIYEDESEEEVDDSKELQIEEALKLYQNALKLHSQGPDFYDQAEAAYQELLSSEIFSYAESLSETRWLELYGEVEPLDDGGGGGGEDEDAVADLPTAVASGEGAPSTLPQVLYLAYKNYGLFRLDRLREQLLQIEQVLQDGGGKDLITKGHSEAATVGLQNLAEALDRDESDLELWRKVARVSQYLGSQRIARFCLETVLNNDDSDVSSGEPLSLEQAFANEQLLPLLASIGDKVAKDETGNIPRQCQNLIQALRKYVDPYPYLPTVDRLRRNLADQTLSKKAADQEIKVPLRTWASCGAAILLRAKAESLHRGEDGAIDSVSGANYYLSIPPSDSSIKPSPDRVINGDTEQHISPANQDEAKASGELGSAEESNAAEVIESPTKGEDDNLEQAILTPQSRSPTSDCQSEQVVPSAGPDNQPDVEQSDGTALLRSSENLNRKRSSCAAELADGADSGRVRSKRIKARGSMTDPAALKDTTAEDWTKWYKQQLDIYVTADEVASKVARQILSTFGCTFDEKHVDEVLVEGETTSPRFSTKTAAAAAAAAAADDLKQLLVEWDLAKSKLFLNGGHSQALENIPNSGVSAFLTQATDNSTNKANRPVFSDDIGLEQFANDIRQQPWTSVGDLAFSWIAKLLEHGSLSSENSSSAYEDFSWPEDLKKTVVQLLVNQDEYISDEVSRRLEHSFRTVVATADSDGKHIEITHRLDEEEEEKLVALVQNIFELHLDIYSRITNPSSEVDPATRAVQHDRLSRWAALASRAMNESSWSLAEKEEEEDEAHQGSGQLMYRFLWASVICNSLQDPSSSEVTVAYFQYLIKQLKADSEQFNRLPTVIILPNNAVMPEVSVQAAEREVSRLATLDYFTNIFSTTDNDPISVIEKLEPLLLLSVAREGQLPQDDPTTDQVGSSDEEQSNAPLQAQQNSRSRDPRLLDSLQFLQRASLSMRLILWQRLQDAYSVVNYPPQILTCNLWSFIIIVRHLESASYLDTSKTSRQENLLRWLHKLDELMTQVLALASTDPSAFECVDQDQLVSSLETVTSLQKIVHVFASWEDEIRIGQTQPTPQLGSAASKAQLKAAEKFREMTVKTWTLQYILVKEATVQFRDVQIPDKELLAYLKAAHNVLGLRTYCGLANKMFLRLAKTELTRLREVEGWDTEMPQVVFDMYGLKISSAPADTQDHGCEPMELDRSTALDVLDLLLQHVSYLSIKELLKNDLRFAVDKMQGVIKVPKASQGSARSFNKRLMIAYLKSPIHPLALYRSIKGIGELCSMAVHTEGHEVAAKGWYFLLGHIALTKFRSQKRITAGSVEDLENAKLFFRQDLEFDSSRWETWYRLAQTFDTQLDEYTTWTAEKLENEKDALVDLQRTAILCYMMAVAAAKRCENGSSEHASTMASLYTDFGIRLYASTREPFNGLVFALDDFKKKFNGAARGMYEDVPFKPVPIYSVWKFASVLLRQAAHQKPRDWYIPYMLGKISWKMHNSSRDADFPVHAHLAVDAIVQAIKCLPERRDSRHPDKDPILEPHYKLLSMVHKLVRSKRHESAIDVEKACHILKATPYARKIPDVQETEDWEQYILAVLKAMRSADKSNWHHRMVVRAAHIIYDENPNDMLALLGAKHELSQQIFTKTMTIQVWKPDNERAGRHFVYTGRYVLFFADLLVKTNDRDNMDLLARRIRRKAGDFANHTRIWHDYSMKYLKLLRKSIPVAEEYEEHIFSRISPEEFSQGANRLETWALASGNDCLHLDLLRDVMEFKKLNNNLMDKTVIENLIADVYAWIYNRYVDELKAKETAEENRVRMSVDTILMNPTPTPFIAMGLLTETAAAAAAAAAGGGGGGGGEQQGRGVRRQFSVTRRMVIGKAEGLIVKPPAIATPRAMPRALAPAPVPGQSAVVAVVIPQEGSNGAEAISVPGSVHDSADDESELSDVEDLVEDPLASQGVKKSPPKPFFPNLLGIKVGDEDAESTVGEEGPIAAAKDEGDAAEEDVEVDSDAEKLQAQGHVPFGGFGSSGQRQNGEDEDGTGLLKE